jgi:hypothetical protein
MTCQEPRANIGIMAVGWLLKRESTLDVDTTIDEHLDTHEGRARVRCPLCVWRPPESSRWCCLRTPSPEGFFGGCGTMWNTFSTRGRCPGCRYQWRWTKCLRCSGWSRHEDWYEERHDTH